MTAFYRELQSKSCVLYHQEFIPHMAKKYGFQYELVQYKWPRWLHQQTEKQRIIWGYKILFLDVLFPLAVDKILFVDADQVRSVSLCLNRAICCFYQINSTSALSSFSECVSCSSNKD